MIYIGIDPGKTGGIVSINEEGSLLSMQPFDKGVSLALALGLDNEWGPDDQRIIIEKVHAMPGQGVTSMFNFGMNFGFIRGWLNASGHKYRMVTPQEWQKPLKGVAGEDAKDRTKNYCEEEWGLSRFILPRCRVPHKGLMDAAAIAHYCLTTQR